MGAPALAIPPGIVRSVRFGAVSKVAPAPASWSLRELSGRLSELSGLGDSACLTLAFSLVLEAQHRGEPVAWVTLRESCFFPADADASGADLEALVVVRLPHHRDVVRATERLARSGAFGLLVADLAAGADKPTALGRGRPATVTTAMQARLQRLAQRHDTAIVCLTRKQPASSSLGSLVSMRCQAHRKRLDDDRFTCEMHALKDKHRGPGWRHVAAFRGPDGLA